MSAKTERILLIGHDPADGRLVREALADVRDGSFIVECAARLVDGLERLRGGGIAAVLLDLCLPDSPGIAAFERVWRAAPLVPILVIRWLPSSSSACWKPEGSTHVWRLKAASM